MSSKAAEQPWADPDTDAWKATLEARLQGWTIAPLS